MTSNSLSDSPVDRQNILNNQYAISEIEKATKIQGIRFEGKTVVLKEQVADFFEVSTRTIETYTADFEQELIKNGYELIKGNRLKEFKLAVSDSDVPEADFGNIKRAPQLSIFDFRAFLNLGMLIKEGDRAQLLRQLILDIAIDTINAKTGGGTKYINQRDEDFIKSSFEEENYRKQFTDALNNYVNLGRIKYAMYTNKVYKSIFKEHAQEYKKVLNLQAKDKVRDTFYSEILDLVASYECGLADIIEKESEKLGRMLSQHEVDILFAEFESQAHWKPLIEKARNKMASRDLAFRDALHKQLEEYITPLQADEFERFLGEKSKELTERLEESKDVLKRLKERG